MKQSPDVNNSFVVDMQPIGRRVEVERGKTILDAAQEAGVGIISLCGGEGWCFSCRVKVISGEVNEVTGEEFSYFSDEEIENGFRLACQLEPYSNLIIDIPPDSLSTPQRLQVEGIELEVPVDPVVKFVDLKIVPPSLDDLQSDITRVMHALQIEGYPNGSIDFPMLSTFSTALRDNNWALRLVLRNKEIIAALPLGSEIYGLAVDIGTTKVAVYLLSLETGQVIDKVGAMNPQIAYGEDIISRIGYTNKNPDGRKTLQEAIINTLNTATADLCKKHDISAAQITDAVIVGNTAMHHLFAGLPVSQLVYAPYVPSVSEALDLKAFGIGLDISPGAYVHLLPNIAGYVGADHTAVILATELWKTEKTILAIDIGTNTEITLAANGRLLSCSCASGPAFEGAHIRDGMRAAPGAIERVQIIGPDEVRLFTIGGELPIGLCGSGILDAVAEMKTNHIINEKGGFDEEHPRVRRDRNNRLEYLIADASKTGHKQDITVTRIDVNEIQLAKGAIRAGLEILLQEAGIEAQNVDTILIAGAFGTYIDVSNAVEIGMFPKIPLDRFFQIGNAAGMGAKLALISQEQRSIIQDVAEKIQYVELTTSREFQDKFIEGMYLH